MRASFLLLDTALIVALSLIAGYLVSGTFFGESLSVVTPEVRGTSFQILTAPFNMAAAGLVFAGVLIRVFLPAYSDRIFGSIITLANLSAIWGHNSVDWALFAKVELPLDQVLSPFAVTTAAFASVGLLIVMHVSKRLRELEWRLKQQGIYRGERIAHLVGWGAITLAVIAVGVITTLVVLAGAQGVLGASDLLGWLPWTIITVGTTAMVTMAVILLLSPRLQSRH